MTYLFTAVIAGAVLGTITRHTAAFVMSRWLWARNSHRLDAWAQELTR